MWFDEKLYAAISASMQCCCVRMDSSVGHSQACRDSDHRDTDSAVLQRPQA